MRYVLLSLLSLALFTLTLAGCKPQETADAGPAAPPLLQAAERGDMPAIEQLLTAQASSNVNVRDHCQWTPLMKAALNGHLEVARRLLDAGAWVDAVDEGGYTALMVAASNNHPTLIRLLGEHGADLNHAEPGLGWTALIWAAKQGHRAAVASLLALGADPQRRDRAGNSAADWARRNGHTAVAALFAR